MPNSSPVDIILDLSIEMGVYRFVKLKLPNQQSWKIGIIRVQLNVHFPTSVASPPPLDVSLSDAQLVLAREHGFRSWPQLKHYVESQAKPGNPSDPAALREELLEAARTGDAKLIAEILDAHPDLKDTADECGWTLLCH